MKRFLNFGVGVKPACSMAFTLAETLIVIGIIGVVAALTLPNLNHATGDKETVTRVMKAYSMLNEASSRAVAIYGPISEWNCPENQMIGQQYNLCYMKRIGEFLKISSSCEDVENDKCVENGFIKQLPVPYANIVYKLSDGMIIAPCYTNSHWRKDGDYNTFGTIEVDINGQNKGKNETGIDIFKFNVSLDGDIILIKDDESIQEETEYCMSSKSGFECTWWVIEYGNLDYLKADEEGKCNDNPSIVLDGVNNTSCH